MNSLSNFDEMIREISSIQNDIQRNMDERKRRIMIVRQKVEAGEMRLTRGWKKLIQEFEQTQTAYNARGISNRERAENAAELLNNVDEMLRSLNLA